MEGIFDARVIPEAQTHRVLNLFAHVLVQLTTAGPDQQVADLDGTSGEDLLQLEAWNREVSPRLPVCVHELIGQHSQSQPEAKAIAAWDGELAYGELDEMSSRLAVSLAKRGVQPETFVPLCMEKSRWVAVAMLAVTKAGGAFILLDPSHPIPRLQQICQDTYATTLFSSVATFDLAKQLGCRHVLPVGAGDKGASTNIPRESDSDDDNNDGVLVPRQARPNSALYAVFTSGSTGKAKGVVIENGAFATNAAVTGPAYLLNKQSRVLQFASHAFDATVLDYLFPLVCGGCVCVPNEAASRDDLAQSINDLQVNWAALTPSVARILNPDALPTLEVLALVGEAAKAVDVATWADRVRLLNAYGPAECAVVSTIRTRIDTASHNPANIGCGAAGATWLVDPNNHDKLAPIGSVGELLLEGPMVGRGYLDNSEQTAASFIPSLTGSVVCGPARTGVNCTRPEIWPDTAGPATALSTISAARTIRSKFGASESSWEKSSTRSANASRWRQMSWWTSSRHLIPMLSRCWWPLSGMEHLPNRSKHKMRGISCLSHFPKRPSS